MTNQYLSPKPQQLQSKIKHIVVLMLENRSFDNLLGWLYDGKKIPNNQSFEGLSRDLWNPLENIDDEGNPFIEKVRIAKNGEKIKFRGKPVSNPKNFQLPDPDPGEGFADTNHQLFLKYKVNSLYPPSALNLGFVQNYQKAMLYGKYAYNSTPSDPRKIMACYTPKQTRILSKLARNFAVCDQYFASVPSQTLPNRAFVHAGTSDGNVNNSPNSFCRSKTIFNQIQEAINTENRKLSWRVFGNNLIESTRDQPGEFGKGHFSLTRLAMIALHDGVYDDNFAPLKQFYDHCETGTLPSYSFLEPNFHGDDQNDQHPPQDIRPGEKLIADIYNAVKNSPKFEETLLIITYDEHGGCYDHVPPPAGAINPDPKNQPGQEGFRFNRFGVRVPCVLINPYITKGLIARPTGITPFDHTSIIKTVQNCFGLDPYLTKRSSAAPDFSCVLRRKTPRKRKDLPKLDMHASIPIQKSREVNDLLRIMASMIGELVGIMPPEDEHKHIFIQENYNSYFGRGFE